MTAINTKRKIVLDLPDPPPVDQAGAVNTWRYKMLNALRQIVQQLGTAQGDLKTVAAVPTPQNKPPTLNNNGYLLEWDNHAPSISRQYLGGGCVAEDAVVPLMAVITNQAGAGVPTAGTYCYFANRVGNRWSHVGSNGIGSIAAPATGGGLYRLQAHVSETCAAPCYVPIAGGSGSKLGHGKIWLPSGSSNWITLVPTDLVTAVSHYHITSAGNAFGCLNSPLYAPDLDRVFLVSGGGTEITGINASTMAYVNKASGYGLIAGICLQVVGGVTQKVWFTDRSPNKLYWMDPVTYAVTDTGMAFGGANPLPSAGAVVHCPDLRALWCAEFNTGYHTLIDDTAYTVYRNYNTDPGCNSVGAFELNAYYDQGTGQIFPATRTYLVAIDARTGYETQITQGSVFSNNFHGIIYSAVFNEFYLFNDAAQSVHVLY